MHVCVCVCVCVVCKPAYVCVFFPTVGLSVFKIDWSIAHLLHQSHKYYQLKYSMTQL